MFHLEVWLVRLIRQGYPGVVGKLLLPLAILASFLFSWSVRTHQWLLLKKGKKKDLFLS